MQQGPSIYTKTLNVKGSRVDSAAAQLAAVMKVLVTDHVLDRQNTAIYLNCDENGIAELDVDIQINPETGTAIWYTAGQFTQITTTASKQVQILPALGYSLRCLPTLSGTHNFGVRVTLPTTGFLTTDTA